jgi:hypothetical protein
MDNEENDEFYEPALREAYRYHRRLGIEYSRAARRPWRSVSPGPSPVWAYPQELVDVLQASAR